MAIIEVIDEHSIYRNGVRGVIEARIANCRVIEGPVSDDPAHDGNCDLVLIDSASFEHGSIERLRHERGYNSRTAFGMLSAAHTRRAILECLAAGFHGFIYKLDTDDELVAAVTSLLLGKMYVPRWIVNDTVAHVAQLETPRLTRRQNEILPLLAEGLSNKEISSHLNIAPGTTKVHTAALLRTLRARNRTQAAFIAAKLVRSRQ